jgi:hypothetical protein
LVPSPGNDDFARRFPVLGLPTVLTGRLEAATVEFGEPFHGATDAQRQSVWWAWTAPSSGITTVSLRETSTGVIPRFAVYIGSSLAQLNLLASGGSQASANAEFLAQQGATYSIAMASPEASGLAATLAVTRGNVPEITFTQPAADLVVPVGSTVPVEVQALDADGGIDRVEFYFAGRLIGIDVDPPYTAMLTNVAYGNYVVSARAFDTDAQSVSASRMISARPENDAFAARVEVVGSPALVRGTTAGATHEPGEPGPMPGGLGTTWWTWTPTESGPIVIAAAGTNVALLLGAYTNDALEDLQLAGSAAPSSSSGALAASVVVEAVAGVPIQIAVDGTASAGLAYELTIRPLPRNDSFADRTRVDGYQFLLEGYNHGATAEVGERSHIVIPSNSVWWTWTAPYTGTLRLNITNNFRSAVAVYSGGGLSLSNLTRLGSVSVPIRGATFTLPVVRDDIYHFTVDGQFGWTGDVRILGRPDGAPVIESLVRTPNALRMRFRGLPGRAHRVDGSSNLQSWLSGEIVVLTGDIGEVDLPLPSGAGSGFYRLTLLP